MHLDKFRRGIILKDFDSGGKEIFRDGFAILRVGKCLRFMS